MNKLKNIIILFVFFIFGCATTQKIIIKPIEYQPSLLEKNPTNVSYHIDDNLKTLTEKEGKIVIYEIFLGDAMCKSIKGVMEKIFYEPKEVSDLNATSENILIKFTKANSIIKRDPGSIYTYIIEINMQIFKNKKLIKEVNFTGETTQYDRHWKIGTTNFQDYQAQVEATCKYAISNVCYKIGEYLMKYNFE